MSTTILSPPSPRPVRAKSAPGPQSILDGTVAAFPSQQLGEFLGNHPVVHQFEEARRDADAASDFGLGNRQSVFWTAFVGFDQLSGRGTERIPQPINHPSRQLPPA